VSIAAINFHGSKKLENDYSAFDARYFVKNYHKHMSNHDGDLCCGFIINDCIEAFLTSARRRLP